MRNLAVNHDPSSIKSTKTCNTLIVFAINQDNTVSFEKQPTGYIHSLGMVSFHPKTKEVGGDPIISTKEGNVITFNARFSIPDDRAFGVFAEVLTLP